MDDGPGMEEHDAGYGRELTPLGGSAQGSALWWLAMDRQDAIDAQIQSKMGVLDSLLAHTDSALDSMKAKPTAGWDAQEGGGIACTAAEGANGDAASGDYDTTPRWAPAPVQPGSLPGASHASNTSPAPAHLMSHASAEDQRQGPAAGKKLEECIVSNIPGKPATSFGPGGARMSTLFEPHTPAHPKVSAQGYRPRPQARHRRSQHCGDEVPLEAAKCRWAMHVWKRWARQRAIDFSRGACDGALAILSQARVRGRARLTVDCWSRVIVIKRRQHGRSAAVQTRVYARLRRLGYHCWHAVWQESKSAAQKWWWEGKLEALTQDVERREKFSHPRETMKLFLHDAGTLTDLVAEPKEAFDAQRATHARLQLQRSGLVRMLFCSICRLVDSIRNSQAHLARQDPFRQQRLNTELPKTSLTSSADYRSGSSGTLLPLKCEEQGLAFASMEAALKTTVFSAWICALATRYCGNVRAVDLRRKLEEKRLSGVLGGWRRVLSTVGRRSKFTTVVLRRAALSAMRRCMRRWRRDIFPCISYAKLRRCRMNNLSDRVGLATVVLHWRKWNCVAVMARHASVVLQRSGSNKRRKLLSHCFGYWSLTAKIQRQLKPVANIHLEPLETNAADPTWLSCSLDSESGNILKYAEQIDARALDDDGVLRRPSIVHLLTEKDMDLHVLREQLSVRDETLAQLRVALIESEAALSRRKEYQAATQGTLPKENLQMESNHVSFQTHFENLNVKLGQTEETMAHVEQLLVQCQHASRHPEAAALSFHQFKESRADLIDIRRTLEEREPDFQVRADSGAHVKVAHNNLEIDALKAQLQLRDSTERELRAALAQRPEGDTVIELLQERNVLRNNLESVRRDLDNARRELEIFQGDSIGKQHKIEQEKINEMTAALRRDLEIYKEEASDAEARVLVADSSCRLHIQTIEKLNGEACGWQWKAAQLLSGLEAAQMKIEEDLLKAEESYRAHRKITHKMHEDKEKEHAQVMSQLAAEFEAYAREADERWRQWASEKAQMEDNLNRAIKSQTCAQEESEKVETELSRTQDALQYAQGECSAALQREDATRLHLHQVQRSLDDAQSNYNRIRQDLLEALNGLTMREEALGRLEETAERAQFAQRKLETWIREHEAKFAAASDTLGRVREENAELNAEISAARVTAAKIAAELVDKEAEIQKSLNQKREYDAMCEVVDKLRQQNRELEESMSTSRRNEEVLRSVVEEAMLTRQRIEIELAEKKEEVLESTKRSAILSSELEVMKTEHEALVEIRQQQEKRIHELASDLDTVRMSSLSAGNDMRKMSVPKDQCSVSGIERQQYEDTIRELNSEIDALRTERSQASTDESSAPEVQTLRSQCESLKKEQAAARVERDEAVLREQKAVAELQRLARTLDFDRTLVDIDKDLTQFEPHTPAISNVNARNARLRPQIRRRGEIDCIDKQQHDSGTIVKRGAVDAHGTKCPADLNSILHTSRCEDQEQSFLSRHGPGGRGYKNMIEITMTLGLNFSAAGDEGTKTRDLFEKSLSQDLASASGLPASYFIVQSLEAGSIVVHMQIVTDPFDGPEALQVAEDLQIQAKDKDSQLIGGILTRYLTSFKVSFPGLRASPCILSGEEQISPVGSEFGHLRTHGIMTPGELLNDEDLEDQATARLLQRQARMGLGLFEAGAKAKVVALQEQIATHATEKRAFFEEIQSIQSALEAKTQENVDLKHQVEVLGMENQALEEKVTIAEQTCREERGRNSAPLSERVRTKSEGAYLHLLADYADDGEAAGNDSGCDTPAASCIQPKTEFSKRRELPTVDLSPIFLQSRHALFSPETLGGALVRSPGYSAPATQGWHLASDPANAAENVHVLAPHTCKNVYEWTCNRHDLVLELHAAHHDVTATRLEIEEQMMETSFQQSTEEKGAYADQVGTLCAEHGTVTKELTEPQRQLEADTAGSLDVDEASVTENALVKWSCQGLESKSEVGNSKRYLLKAETGVHTQQTSPETIDGVNDSSRSNSLARVEKEALVSKDALIREVAALRLRLEEEEVKAAAAAASMKSMDEMSKIHYENWRLQWEMMRAEKDDVEVREASAQKSVDALTGRLTTVEDRLAEAQDQLRAALQAKAMAEQIGEGRATEAAIIARKKLENELHDVKACRDALERTSSAWQSQAVAETNKNKVNAATVATIEETVKTLEVSYHEINKGAAHLKQQRDAAVASTASSELKVRHLEQILIASTAFLRNALQRTGEMPCQQDAAGERQYVNLSDLTALNVCIVEETLHPSSQAITDHISALQVSSTTVQAMQQATMFWQSRAQTLSAELAERRRRDDEKKDEELERIEDVTRAIARAVRSMDACADPCVAENARLALSGQMGKEKNLGSMLSAVLQQVVECAEKTAEARKVAEECKKQRDTALESLVRLQEQKDADREQAQRAIAFEKKVVVAKTTELEVARTELNTQIPLAAEKRRQLEQDNRNLVSKIHVLERENSSLQDSAREQKVREESVQAHLNRAHARLTETNVEGIQQQQAHAEAIESISSVCDALEVSFGHIAYTCKFIVRIWEELEAKNDFHRTRLQRVAAERDEALADRDHANASVSKHFAELALLQHECDCSLEEVKRNLDEQAKTIAKQKQEIVDHEETNKRMSKMCEHVSKSIEGLESSCQRWDEVCSSLTWQNNSLHARIEFLKSQVYESNWARSCAEVDRDEALLERRGHEKSDQQMALMVENLEDSCRMWERTIDDMRLRKEFLEQQVLDAYHAEVACNRDWTTKLETCNRDWSTKLVTCQADLDLAVTERKTIQREFEIACSKIESVESSLKTAHEKCHGMMARERVMKMELVALEGLCSAWSLAAEEILQRKEWSTAHSGRRLPHGRRESEKIEEMKSCWREKIEMLYSQIENEHLARAAAVQRAEAAERKLQDLTVSPEMVSTHSQQVDTVRPRQAGELDELGFLQRQVESLKIRLDAMSQPRNEAALYTIKEVENIILEMQQDHQSQTLTQQTSLNKKEASARVRKLQSVVERQRNVIKDQKEALEMLMANVADLQLSLKTRDDQMLSLKPEFGKSSGKSAEFDAVAAGSLVVTEDSRQFVDKSASVQTQGVLSWSSADSPMGASRVKVEFRELLLNECSSNELTSQKHASMLVGIVDPQEGSKAAAGQVTSETAVPGPASSPLQTDIDKSVQIEGEHSDVEALSQQAEITPVFVKKLEQCLLKLEVDLLAIQGQLRVSFGEGSHLQSAATTKTRSDHAAGTHNEPEDNVEQNGGRMCSSTSMQLEELVVKLRAAEQDKDMSQALMMRGMRGKEELHDLHGKFEQAQRAYEDSQLEIARMEVQVKELIRERDGLAESGTIAKKKITDLQRELAELVTSHSRSLPLASSTTTSAHYGEDFETPLKVCPAVCTSEEIKNARNHKLLCIVLAVRRNDRVERQGFSALAAWLRRQVCIGNIAMRKARKYLNSVLLDIVRSWRNQKRRQQHRRRIASKKIEDVTAPIRTLRLVSDSFAWWRVTSGPVLGLQTSGNIVPLNLSTSPPLWAGAGRVGTGTPIVKMSSIPITSARQGDMIREAKGSNAITPRESFGAVASAGAALKDTVRA